MYKLLAIDLDGTLLKNDKTISENNCKAINKAIQKGIKVVLATGRPIDGIRKYIEKLNLLDKDDFSVAFNGAAVQNNKTKEIIYREILNKFDLNYLYNLSKELGVNIHVLTKDGCITPKSSKYSIYESKLNDIPLKILDFNKINDNINLIKIMMIDEENILDSAIKKFPKDIYEKYTVLRSEPFFLEFLNKNTNKAQGIKKIAERFNIKKDEIICVGDSGNDVHMIEYAGLGVAMGNAKKELKKIANYITDTNENDGVAKVIKKFIEI